MLKSPFGALLAVTAAVLALSPEARKGARKLAVKGAKALLDLTDQVKSAASRLQSANSASNEQKK